MLSLSGKQQLSNYRCKPRTSRSFQSRSNSICCVWILCKMRSPRLAQEQLEYPLFADTCIVYQLKQVIEHSATTCSRHFRTLQFRSPGYWKILAETRITIARAIIWPSKLQSYEISSRVSPNLCLRSMLRIRGLPMARILSFQSSSR